MNEPIHTNTNKLPADRTAVSLDTLHKRKESEMTKPEGSDHKYEVWLDLDDDPWNNEVSDIWDIYDSYEEAKKVFTDMRKKSEYFDDSISIVDSAGDVLDEIGPRQILEASYAYRVEVDVRTIVENAKIADENNDLQDLVDCPDGKIFMSLTTFIMRY